MTDPYVELARKVACGLRLITETMANDALSSRLPVQDWQDRINGFAAELEALVATRHPSTELGDEVPEWVTRFIALLDASDGVQGVHIDHDECKPLADDLRQLLAALRQSTRSVDDGGDYEAWRRFEAAISAEARRLCRTGCTDEPCHCRADLDKDWRRDAINSLRPHPPSTEICAEKACGRGKAGV